MSGKCFDIGTIQAFLDGETAPELSAAVTNHVSACDLCAVKLADADEENSIVFSALDREFNTLVPTQRLWTRINETITVEKSQHSVWQRILAAFPLASPSFAAFAGIVMLIGFFAVVNGLRDGSGEDIASSNAPAGLVRPPSTAAVQQSVPAEIRTDENDIAAPPSAFLALVKESRIPADKIRNAVSNAKLVGIRDRPRYENAVAAAPAYLPGEVSYVKTISELKESVDGQKDRVLTPSSRIAYERDMAVVNDSIKRMQTVVRGNPRNQAAKQVLYSAYQDKIDLLNSVAQQEELMASLR